MDIVLFGIQGSGKGTQARLIAEKYNMAIFEAGAELRKIAAQENSELGQKIKQRIDNGLLVEPELIVSMAEEFVTNNRSRHIIFDGIPRSLVQKQLFDQMTERQERKILYVHILVPVQETLERLYRRAETEKRIDDSPAKIHHRQQIFHQETEPVIELYRTENRIITINGDQNVDQVSAEMYSMLDPYKLI